MSDKREPMLSDVAAKAMAAIESRRKYYLVAPSYPDGPVREDLIETGIILGGSYYEDLIDKGVLMVVKETTRSLEAYRDWCDQTFYRTDCCNRTVDDEGLFCPNCGARIKQA